MQTSEEICLARRMMRARLPLLSTLILRAARKRGVSKDEGPIVASWFETRFALLTMRVETGAAHP